MIRRRLGIGLLALLPVLLAAVAVGAVLFARQGGFAPYRVPRDSTRTVASDAQTLARGEYLVRLGDCAACHTTRGGVPFAGGVAFRTGYGTIYSTNITPDREHGIGDWSPDEFAHAMRHGVSRQGPLFPVFPYEQFATLTDADIDAIYAWLRTVAPSDAPAVGNRLEFPANSRNALIGWRMLYYRPSSTAPGKAAVDRGQYLVDGAGHCASCHSARGDRYSLPPDGYLAGGSLPVSGWYAPPLDSDALARFQVAELADYLRTGTSPHGAAYGPMAQVIYGSLAALDANDAAAIASYLKRVAPRTPKKSRREEVAGAPGDSANGAEVYKRACSDCHGDDGEGKAGRYPPLGNSVAATAPDPVNAVRVVLYGAMEPTTPGNPRPFSMPPFAQQLTSAEIAAVVNYIRRDATPPSRLTADEVESMHGVVLE
ncbi:MAG: cytochrome c [Rhodanobacteraceae bacterium]